MALKLIMVHLIIWILIQGGLTSPLLSTNMEKDIRLYTEKAELFLDFTWLYFEDRYSVSIFAYEDAPKDFSYEIMKGAFKNGQKSVLYNSGNRIIIQEQLRRKPNESDIYFFHHEVNGLIYVAESAEKIENIFHAIDQQTKTIIILTNTTSQDIKNLLVSAWKQYNILNLVAFYFETANLIKGAMPHFLASVYDPFIIRNGIRGHVYTYIPSIRNNIWTNLSKVINTRLNDVHGYPLRIITPCFEEVYKPMVNYLPCDILHALFDSNHFKITQSVLGKNADMFAYALHPMGYNVSKFTEFLFPVDKDEYGFITPKVQPSSTVSFLHIYAPVVSTLLACAYISTVIIWNWLQRLHKKCSNIGRNMDFSQISVVIFGNFLLISQPGTDRYYERCLSLSWILFSMVICFSYQATMVEHLTIGGPSRDINTLDGLLESNFKILIPHNHIDMIKDIVINEEAPYLYKRILDRSKVILWVGHGISGLKNTAMFGYISYCKDMQDIHVATYGVDGVHVLEKGPPGRYLSFLLPSDTPYKESFNHILMRIVEHGIMQKLRNNNFYAGKMERLKQYGKIPVIRKDIYRMKDLSFIFWSLFCCCCFCSLVFLMELLWARVCKIMSDFTIAFLSNLT